MRVGSLFSGYDGIGLALTHIWPDAQPAWFVEFDTAPSRILAHHWPTVPNYGDVTTVDWAAVEPVDILTGGFPCQDLSHAGKRAGLRPGTRSGLWEHMAYAINELRPRMVVIENVRGLLSASAASDLEPCAWCVGGAGDGEPALRALGSVLGDLADLGYDAEWVGVRAAVAGAPHGRFRVFVVAHPHRVGQQLVGGAVPGRATGVRPVAGHPPHTPTHPHGAGRGEHGRADPVRAEHAAAERPGAAAGGGLTWIPAPSAVAPDQQGRTSAPGYLEPCYSPLLPTPTTMDSVDLRDLDNQIATRDKLGLAEEVRLLPPPRPDFGPYAPAIARWEAVLCRPSPSPTEPGKDGRPRLSPRFVEWMMGLPAGHVTDPAIGLTRAQQLKALGNGVVPQQAALALRMLLGLGVAPAGSSGALLPTPEAKLSDSGPDYARATRDGSGGDDLTTTVFRHLLPVTP